MVGGSKGTVEMYGESSKKQDEQRSGITTDCASLKPRADLAQQALNPLSVFKFKSLTQKKPVHRVACVSSLESRF